MSACPEISLSVVIPVYSDGGDGRIDSLREAIDSARAQTVRAREIIVVDDGSPAPARAALEALAGDDIRVLRLETNGGAAAARNAGVEAAQGTYVAFLDSDDVWYEAKLQRQSAVLGADQSGALAGVCCAFDILYKTPSDWSAPETYCPAPVETLARMAGGCDLSPGTGLILKKEAFQSVGGFDTSFRRFEDWDFFIRLMDMDEAARIAIVRDPLCRIKVGKRPPASLIETSARHMRQRHAGTFTRKPAKRLFEGTLIYECGVARWYEGRKGAALCAAAKAVFRGRGPIAKRLCRDAYRIFTRALKSRLPSRDS